MSDESDPIAPPQESGPPGLDSNRPDPLIIEGEAREAPPERPAQAPRLTPAPTRGGAPAAWLVPTAIVGGLIGYGLVQFLNPPPDVAGLAAAVQAVKDAQGAAAKASDVKALAARVDGLEKSAAAAKAAGASPSAPDATAVNARLDALDAGLKALSGKPDATQPLQEKLTALEASVARLKATPAPRRDGLALSALTEGLSLRFDAGAPFAGELATLKLLGADPDSLALLAPMADGGAPTPQKIAAAFEAIAPALVAAPAPAATPSPPPADQGLTGAVMARLASLVKVRVKDAPPPPDATGPSATIRAALARGDLAAAAAAFAPLRDKAGAAGDAWAGLIDQRARGLAAVAKLRAGADDALKAAAP